MIPQWSLWGFPTTRGRWSNEVTKGGCSAGNRGQISTTLNCWHQSKHHCIAVVIVFCVSVLKIKLRTKSFTLLQNIKLKILN